MQPLYTTTTIFLSNLPLNRGERSLGKAQSARKTITLSSSPDTTENSTPTVEEISDYEVPPVVYTTTSFPPPSREKDGWAGERTPCPSGHSAPHASHPLQSSRPPPHCTYPALPSALGPTLWTLSPAEWASLLLGGSYYHTHLLP